MKKNISPKIIALTFGILVICFAVGFYIFAWTGPTAPPPQENVSISLGGSLKAMWITSFFNGICNDWDDATKTWYVNGSPPSLAATTILLNEGGNSLLASTESKTYYGPSGGCDPVCANYCATVSFNKWIKCADGLAHKVHRSVTGAIQCGGGACYDVVYTHTCVKE